MFLLAQPQDDKKKQEFEEFKEKRIAFITQAMDLSKEEANAFWPLCNELHEKKFELNQQLMKAMREFNKIEKSGKKHSESEYKKFVEFCADTRIKEAQLEREYYTEKFSKVIPVEKIFLYLKAEQKFARLMLEDRQGDKKEKDKK
jgi:uncharacterized protein YifE (UPF0438 family)